MEFLKVYEKLDTFDETKSSVSTWIFTITRNTLTDYFRTRRVFSEIPEELPAESDIEENYCQAEMLDTLADALSALPERKRDLIMLHYYSGKTLKEAAENLGISYAYVKILHNKALVSVKHSFLYYFLIKRINSLPWIGCARKGGGRRWAGAQLGRQRILAQARPEGIDDFNQKIVLQVIRILYRLFLPLCRNAGVASLGVRRVEPFLLFLLHPLTSQNSLSPN